MFLMILTVEIIFHCAIQTYLRLYCGRSVFTARHESFFKCKRGYEMADCIFGNCFICIDMVLLHSLVLYGLCPFFLPLMEFLKVLQALGKE